MKTLAIAGVAVALNSTVWAEGAWSVLQGASEPSSLVVWGIALFVGAGMLKKGARAEEPARAGNYVEANSWITRVMPRGAHFRPAANEGASLDHRLGARV